MKFANCLMKMQPGSLEVALVPRELEVPVKNYSMSGAPLSDEDVIQYVPDVNKASKLLRLLETERSNQMKYDEVTMSRR